MAGDDPKMNPEMELVETSLGTMERWRARAIGIGMTSNALAHAGDARQDAARGGDDPIVVEGEEKEAREMHLDEPVKPSEDCGQEENERADNKLAIAKAVAHRDEGEDEPEELSEPDLPEDDPDPEEQVLREVLASLSRLDERMTALESSRAERLALDAEIERHLDEMTPPTPEKPMPALPSLPN
jgi:hypothetical protein